jgi:tubby-related protein 1
LIAGGRRKQELVARVRAGQTDELAQLINKPPVWNDEIGANTLNFNKRVTMPSVKNFLLVSPGDHDVNLMLFGKTEKSDNIFSLDFQWPLSAAQAFAIGISAVDLKPGCQ